MLLPTTSLFFWIGVLVVSGLFLYLFIQQLMQNDWKPTRLSIVTAVVALCAVIFLIAGRGRVASDDEVTLNAPAPAAPAKVLTHQQHQKQRDKQLIQKKKQEQETQTKEENHGLKSMKNFRKQLQER